MLLAVALGDPSSSGAGWHTDQPTWIHHLPRWNVIRAEQRADEVANTTEVPAAVRVHLTVWLPASMIAAAGQHHGMQPKADAPAKRIPDSIQLWLNRTSLTEVRLAPAVDRQTIHIYGGWVRRCFALIEARRDA